MSRNQMGVRMKMPDECCGLSDVRREIDSLDKEIVALTMFLRHPVSKKTRKTSRRLTG